MFEFQRLLRYGLAVSVRSGAMRDVKTKLVEKHHSFFVRVRLAIPGFDKGATVVFDQKDAARAFEKSLLKVLWQAENDREYNAAVTAALEQLKDGNPDIEEKTLQSGRIVLDQ